MVRLLTAGQGHANGVFLCRPFLSSWSGRPHGNRPAVRPLTVSWDHRHCDRSHLVVPLVKLRQVQPLFHEGVDRKFKRSRHELIGQAYWQQNGLRVIIGLVFCHSSFPLAVILLWHYHITNSLVMVETQGVFRQALT